MNARTLPARRTLAGLSLLAAGLVGGGALAAGVGPADAATTAPSASAAATSGSTSSATKTKTDKAAETALTGDVLAEVKAAVSAKYPGATFEKVTTDSDGVYEADITTTAGDKTTVEVDKAYAVTGTEAHTGRGGRGGHGGKGGGAGETALTGDTLAQVKAAVSAKYPGASFERVETDNGGVYEAHITTAAGEKLTVAVDKAFAITGTESH